jgi:hypothetical protein
MPLRGVVGAGPVPPETFQPTGTGERSGPDRSGPYIVRSLTGVVGAGPVPPETCRPVGTRERFGPDRPGPYIVVRRGLGL